MNSVPFTGVSSSTPFPHLPRLRVRTRPSLGGSNRTQNSTDLRPGGKVRDREGATSWGEGEGARVVGTSKPNGTSLIWERLSITGCRSHPCFGLFLCGARAEYVVSRSESNSQATANSVLTRLAAPRYIYTYKHHMGPMGSS